MPAPLSSTDVYAADRPGNLSPVVSHARPLVYIPNTNSNTVTVIDQRSMRVTATVAVGNEPQHVVPSYDLRTLYVASDHGNVHGGAGTGSLAPINPVTGKPGRPIDVVDPYNLYFTPDGRFAIVVGEARNSSSSTTRTPGNSATRYVCQGALASITWTSPPTGAPC